MSVLLEEKLPVIPASNKATEKSCSCHKNYDELTGLKPNDPIVSAMQGMYDGMTGETFILPSGQENYSDNLSSDIVTRKASESTKEAPIHVIYINGINTNKTQYDQSF